MLLQNFAILVFLASASARPCDCPDKKFILAHKRAALHGEHALAGKLILNIFYLKIYFSLFIFLVQRNGHVGVTRFTHDLKDQEEGPWFSTCSPHDELNLNTVFSVCQYSLATKKLVYDCNERYIL